MEPDTRVVDIPSGKEEKKRGLFRAASQIFQEFSSNSTLHGLRYISDDKRSRSEKIFWGIITVISVCVCVWGCCKTWAKWRDTPIIMAINEDLMCVTEVPFPAVTICPQVKIKSFNYTEEYNNILKYMKSTPKEWWEDEEQARQHITRYRDKNPAAAKLAATQFLCKNYLNKAKHQNFYPDEDDKDFVRHIIEEAPTMEEIFERATWRLKPIPREKISEIFTPVLTANGMCYTFNGIAADEMFHLDRIHKGYPYSGASTPSRHWAPDRGYFNTEKYRRNPTIDEIYPRRGEEKNLFETDLNLVLGTSLPQDARCSGSDYLGFKVILHHPAEQPRRVHTSYAAELNQIATINVIVEAVTTSDTLVGYPPKVRQCYYPSEKPLKYVKVYSPTSCELDCLTNYTFNRCGCFWFHMPNHNISNLCSSYKQAICVKEAYGNFTTSEMWIGENGCQCLPPCYNIQYDAQIIKDSFHHADYSETVNKENETTAHVHKRQYTEIKMHFKKSRFVTLRRSELFGSTDFLANCGGLLGLFLGFSFLSLVELFYFFTLRLFYMIRGQKKSEPTKIRDGAAHARGQDALALQGTRL